jgi:serine/threonine protein kinase
MAAGRLPWTTYLRSDVESEVMTEQFVLPESTEPQIQNMVSRILRMNPAERPTVQQLLADPWLSGLSGTNGQPKLKVSASASAAGVPHQMFWPRSPVRQSIAISKSRVIVRPELTSARAPMGEVLRSSITGSAGAPTLAGFLYQETKVLNTR